MMLLVQHPTKERTRAAALVIVLAFIVLMTGLAVAYFARTTTDRQLAKSNFDNVAAEILARSALNIIVGDFKQEIADGLTPPVPAENIVPRRNVPASAAIPNLIRISLADAIAAPAVPTRASNVNSANPLPTPSISTRLVTKARWNKHYLIPRDPAVYGGTTTIGTDPVPSFTAPDWILVNNLGPLVLAAPDSSVIGRYAYAVYDEGGLLDVNVAGFPSPTSSNATYITNIGRKGVLAFANLGVTGLSDGAVDNIVGWRNYLSGTPTGSYSTFAFPVNPTDFVTYFLNTTRDFLTANAPTTYPSSGSPPRIDQSFITRSQLLELRRTLISSQDAMQYLGTFSREINHSTWGTSLTLLLGRFPLSRFDLFEDFRPSMTPQALQHFRLVRQPRTGGPTGHEEHWRYTGTGSTNPASSISTLTGVGLDPDLPALLNYALPGRPIGEILSIVASLIDQVDSNDETTWVEYSSVGSLTPDLKAFGVDRTPSTEPDAPTRPATIAVLNRAFRNVGEIGYAYKNGSTGVDFNSATSSDASMLDLFTYNTATQRAGFTNLNTQNAGVLAAIIQGAYSNETASTKVRVGDADPSTDPYITATTAANAIITHSTNGTAVNPILGRYDVARLVASTGTTIGTGEEERETVARALAEVGQTRVWGLLIDVVAQTGRYKLGTTNLADFIVQAEKRYWLHIAIDRLTGNVIDQQLEAVYE